MSINNSKTNKRLVLLTSRYPFRPGDEFLETEISYLSEAFEEIHIIPVNYVEKEGDVAREVPANVQVHILKPTPSSVSKKVLVKEMLRDPQGRDWFMAELKKVLRKHPKAVLRLANWIGLAVAIKKAIPKGCVTPAVDNSSTVYYSYWMGPSATALAMLKENDPSMKVLSRAHGGDLYAYRHNPPVMPAQERMIQTLDQVFVISQDGANYLNSTYPSVSHKLSVSRLGTNMPDQSTSPSTDDTLRILTCSYMKPVKRLHLLAEALHHTTQKIEWSHIGDGPMREEVEAKLQGKPDNVNYRFLGSKKNDEVYDYYKSEPVDLFVNISSSEGVPVSIMEAFSFKVPVFATDVGGTKELVNSSTGRLLSKDFDPAMLGKWLDEYAQLSPQEKEAYSKKAYQKWEDDFYSKTNYSRFAETLTKF